MRTIECGQMTVQTREHPGGEQSIFEYAGKDATKAFKEIGHSTDAIREMKSCKVGIVKPEPMQPVTRQPTIANKSINGKQPPENRSYIEKKEKTICFCC
ncbi:cytochrome b5 [Eurosta solidaginis]|uniref:cytochrome b5 n=1 Tax=Eurosta solidaginis TaxID=178769 RepID=UPI003530E39C